MEQIIDQIGALLQQLPPEQQMQVIEQLAALVQGQQQENQGDPNAAPGSEPVRM